MAIMPDGPLGVSDMWKYLNLGIDSMPDVHAMAQIAAQNAQYAQSAHALAQAGKFATYMPHTDQSAGPPNTGTISLANRARELFLKRMGGIRAEMVVAPGDYVNCHVYGETVFLFYCFAGREGCAREHWDLFPSDQFITQFRMILA